jgi:hypothetical protein
MILVAASKLVEKFYAAIQKVPSKFEDCSLSLELQVNGFKKDTLSIAGGLTIPISIADP